MRPLLILGLALGAAGVAGLVYGGFTYTKDSQTADLGGIEISVQEKKTVPLPPILSAAGLVLGTILVVRETRRSPGS